MHIRFIISLLIVSTGWFITGNVVAMDVVPIDVPEPDLLAAIAVTSAAVALYYRSKRNNRQ